MRNLLKFGLPVLLAVLIVGSMFGSASAKPVKGKDNTKELANKIEKDLRETGTYSERDLDELIEVIAKTHNIALSENKKEEAKRYVLREIKKKIKLQKIKKTTISIETYKPIKVTTESGITYQIQTSGPISTFFQPIVDITGGSGYDDHNNYYNVNGDNDLYRVDVEQVLLYQGDTSCPVGPTAEYYTMYTLYYYDEDHRDPSWDAFYDDVRRAVYGRTEDIETFYVRWGDNLICFDEIWSNDETFYPFWGQHGTATFPYTSTIYIAVWNHAMDVDDDNPSLSKVSMP